MLNTTIANETSQYLSQNLEILLKTHEINCADLAKKLNLPYNTIHRILMGTTSDPRISTLQQIAEYFGVSLDFLYATNQSNHFNKKNNSIVPFYDWSQLTDPNFLTQVDAQKWINVADLDVKDGLEHFFAIDSTKSMQPRFPINTTFILKNNEAVIDGDLVLIRFRSDNALSLRELVIDSPHWQLKPIISDSTTILFTHEEHMVIGVVILTVIHTRSI